MARSRVHPKQLSLFSARGTDPAYEARQRTTDLSPAARRVATSRENDPRLRVGAAGFIPDPLMRPAWQIDGKPDPALRQLAVPVRSEPIEAAHTPLTHAIKLPWDFRTTFPNPLESAIDAGRLDPSDCEPENLAALHVEHANAALAILADLDLVERSRRNGTDPATGSPPRTAKQKERLEKLHTEEPPRLRHAFGVLIDVYGEAFGDSAADAFRKSIEARHAGIEVVASPPTEHAPVECSHGKSRHSACYHPGHPWHYLKEGDDADPLPFEAIHPAESGQLGAALPKDAAKRRAKLQAMLVDAERQLRDDEARYHDLLARGVEALSDYDRDIAYGGNDRLAWASAVALKFNHITNGKGRVLLLRKSLST